MLIGEIFLRGRGVGQNLLKDSITLSDQRRHWSHFSVQTRRNLFEFFFGVIVVKKKCNLITTN